jgi:D-sedoheptulose 7-phosphate isomerase
MMKTAGEFASTYLKETLPLFEEYRSQIFIDAMSAMIATYEAGGTVYICGNGGSAGTSNHMVNDLSKGSVVEGKRRLRVLGLADNMSLLTAYANDCGYETIFIEQMKNLWRKGDLLIAISASGNSENVVRAAQYARQTDGKVISLVGFSGGKLKELSDFAIHFKSFNYGAVEDAQLMFSHMSSQYMHHYIQQKGPAFEAGL